MMRSSMRTVLCFCLLCLGNFPLLLNSVTLTSSQHDWIKNNLKTYFNFNDTGSYGLPCNDKVKSCPVGNTLGALVRLVFHDAAGTGGSNGCIDFNTSDHNGLQDIVKLLDTFYYSKEGYFDDYTSMLSKADLWILAGNLAIEYASNASGSAGSALEILPSTPGGLVLPFQYGRYDASTCDDTHMLPEASYNWTQMRHLFVDRFGMDVGEAVAIMGAHSLGRCEWKNSGFDGGWLTTASSFSNQYYIEMGNVKWNNSNNSAVWIDDLPEGGAVQKPYTVMLQVDVELLYQTKLRAPNNYCDEFSDYTSKRVIKCPKQTETFPHFMAYAGNISHFFGNFSTAWEKMTEYNMKGLVPLGKPCNGTYPLTTSAPTQAPTSASTIRKMTPTPTIVPTGPTVKPSIAPTVAPTAAPTLRTYTPSVPPTIAPSTPSVPPTIAPSMPTVKPTAMPSWRPTRAPSFNPTVKPTRAPSFNPTVKPSPAPSFNPTVKPSLAPSAPPSTAFPSFAPAQPSLAPATQTVTQLVLALKQTFGNVSSDLSTSSAFKNSFRDTIMAVLSYAGIAADSVEVPTKQDLRFLAASTKSNLTVSYIVTLTLERSSVYTSTSELQSAVSSTITSASLSTSSAADGSSLLATLKRFGAQEGVSQLQGASAASAPVTLSSSSTLVKATSAPSIAPTAATGSSSTSSQFSKNSNTAIYIYTAAAILFVSMTLLGVYTIFHKQIKHMLGLGKKQVTGSRGVVDVDEVTRVSEAGYTFDHRPSYFGGNNPYREQLKTQGMLGRAARAQDTAKEASAMVMRRATMMVRQASTLLFSKSSSKEGSVAMPARRKKSIFDSTSADNERQETPFSYPSSAEGGVQMTTNPLLTLNRNSSLGPMTVARMLGSSNNPLLTTTTRDSANKGSPQKMGSARSIRSALDALEEDDDDDKEDEDNGEEERPADSSSTKRAKKSLYSLKIERANKSNSEPSSALPADDDFMGRPSMAEDGETTTL